MTSLCLSVNQPNPRGGEAAVMRVNPTLQHTARKDGTELWYGILGAECGGKHTGRDCNTNDRLERICP